MRRRIPCLMPADPALLRLSSSVSLSTMRHFVTTWRLVMACSYINRARTIRRAPMRRAR